MSAPQKTPETEWEQLKTQESREVERELRKAFTTVDAYRYNSASLRVRIIDAQFAGLSREERVDRVEPHLDKLPEKTQEDIMNLILLSPDELSKFSSQTFTNLDFEHPSRSML